MRTKTEFKNERYPAKTRADIKLQRAYGEWIQEDYVWNWYVTLTFSHDVSANDAKSRLLAYFNEIEEHVRAPLGCIITQEQAAYSGLGKPGGRLHFHLLLYCAKSLSRDLLEDRWQQPCYGGNRTSGASARAKPYNGAISASLYLFKDLHHPSSDCLETSSPEQDETQELRLLVSCASTLGTRTRTKTIV